MTTEYRTIPILRKKMQARHWQTQCPLMMITEPPIQTRVNEMHHYIENSLQIFQLSSKALSVILEKLAKPPKKGSKTSIFIDLDSIAHISQKPGGQSPATSFAKAGACTA